jgi:cytochrome c oxidase subunit II
VRPKPRAAVAGCLVLLLAFALAGSAAAANGGFTPPTPRSANAGRITDAYYLILGLTAGVFVLVEGALLLFVFRFRSRGRPRSVEGPQIRGHTNLELAWTIVPVLILAAIASFVFYKLPGIKDVPAASAGDTLRVKVEGHQFYWQLDYPGGQVSINRLVVPQGRVVTLDVVSGDVAHSWWIPALGGKIDAIPGRTNHTWFQAGRLGTYQGQCAEFCGLQHAAMKAQVQVVTDTAYARFLAAHAKGSPAVGAEMWTGACATCHGLSGQGYVGPRIAGNSILQDRKSLTTLVRNGLAPARTINGMPAVGNDWSDAQIGALLRYFKRHPNPGATGGG